MNGVITDSHGRFNITVKAGAVLQFSSIGYTDKEVIAAPGMKVTLEDDSELLSEVVVVGYGSQKGPASQVPSQSSMWKRLSTAVLSLT